MLLPLELVSCVTAIGKGVMTGSLPLEKLSYVTAIGKGVVCYCHWKRCRVLLPLEKVSYVTVNLEMVS